MEHGAKGMARYELVGTNEDPAIAFDAQTGILEIAGNSMPENPLAVYAPAMEWLRSYVSSPAQRTSVRFRLKYYNTSTSKIIINILDLLGEVRRSGHEIEVSWYFTPGDEDLEEAGYEFSENCIIPFRVVPIGG